MAKLKKIEYEKILNDLLIISKLINENEKILDVGCGDGKLIDYLNIRMPNAEELNKTIGVNLCLKRIISNTR